jgi:subtilisin family serine protease
MRKYTWSVAAASLVIGAVIAVPTTSAAPLGRPMTPPNGSVAPLRTHLPGVARDPWAGVRVPGRTLGPPAPASPAPARVAHLDARLQAAPAAADGSIEVTMHGAAAALAAAVRRSGGRAVATVTDALTAVVPKSQLAELAASPGVQSVARPVRAYTDAVSQGVAASAANTWQSSGFAGQGVTIGIVDTGFTNLAAEVTAGRLPAGTKITGNLCADPNLTPHGTAVTEVVHDMAPSASLALYCVDDNIGFKAAEAQLQAAGVKIVNSSLGFPGDSRGDGSGDANSTAATVHTARSAGILWIQSAGNNATDHWGGTFADVNHDGLADLNPGVDPAKANPQMDDVAVPAGGSAALILQWDHWPASTTVDQLSFSYQQFNPANGSPIGSAHTVTAVPGLTPWLSFNVTNSGASDAYYRVWVGLPAGTPAYRYDLSYWGDVYISHYAQLNPAAAAAESITEPASSPFAVAAGAAYWQSKALENFSSQGPTIDGRVKPDITGFDGVNSPIYGNTTGPADQLGFYGTSAAAPHVAGAAALVKSAHPSWTADQLQDYLERLAGNDPPSSNKTGAGILHLGTPATDTLPASRFVTLSQPVRILDTRSGIGGHLGAMAAYQSFPVAIPASANVPATATSVVVNLSGISPVGATGFAVYGDAWAGATNLNITPTDAPNVVLAVAPLAADRTFTLRNTGASQQAVADLVGYFDTASGDGYATTTGVRLLDTRTTVGGHPGKLADGATVRVPLSGKPVGAHAVLVNVTAMGVGSGSGFLGAYGNVYGAKPTVDVGRYNRANLAIVPIASDGSIYIRSAAPATDVVVDLVGWFATSATNVYVGLRTPLRKSDTRTGLGGTIGALANGATAQYAGASALGVAGTARVLFTSTTSVPPDSGFLVTYPAGATRPGVSMLSYSDNRVVPNALMATLGSAGKFAFYSSGSTQLVVDLFGYFAPPG